MDLHDALTQITEIRRQLARTEVFRGYRAMPITFSGLLALGSCRSPGDLVAPAGGAAGDLPGALGHAAMVSMVALGVGLLLDYRQNRSPLMRSTMMLASASSCHAWSPAGC